MDTVAFVKDRKWPNTGSRILEIPVAGLGNVAVQDWSMLDDARFAGYLLPGPLRDRYFGLLDQDDDPPEAAWDAFMDDLWEAVDAIPSSPGRMRRLNVTGDENDEADRQDIQGADRRRLGMGGRPTRSERLGTRR